MIALLAGAPPAAAQATLEDVAPPAERRWEGAIGLLADHGAAYPGSSEYGVSLKPGLFVRWGRVTLTTTSGLITRRADDVSRGLGVDLQPADAALRFNVSLRLDRGRRDSSADALAGLGDIDSTLRIRLGARWQATERWQWRAALNLDAAGRGGGDHGELGFTRQGRASGDTVWSWGGNLGFGTRQYLQSYHGITEAQAARTGYPVYRPRAGLRDVSLHAGLRTVVAGDWVLLAGASASRVLGPVAHSPLTRQRFGWGLSGGLAWRF